VRTSRSVSRIGGGVPFELDLLDQDLEVHFGDLGGGRPLSWGLAVGAVPNSWISSVSLQGVDWSIRLHLPGELKIPRACRSSSGRTSWTTIRQHCALLAVHTRERSINAARDVGRPAVRALLALVRRELPVLLPSHLLWEGVLILKRTEGRIGMTTAQSELESATPAKPERLHRIGLELAPISLSSMPSPLVRALGWLASARSARVRTEKFMHLWLAVLALASYKQPVKDPDMKRIRTYTATMGTGIGGVLSRQRIEDLNRRFGKAYDARNALFHRDDDSKVTLELLQDLEAAAFELVDFELRKTGVTIAE
jgi:hypothetical protein